MPNARSALPIYLYLCIVLCATSAADDFLVAGRHFNPDKRFTVMGRAGQIDSIEGSVEETTRRLFTVTGRDDKQDNAEGYSFDDLGIDTSDISFGISMEYLWKYISLELDLAYVHAEANETAKRDFFIGVDDVTFNGQKFEYMVLPEGVEYDAELDSAMIGIRGLITPFTLNPGGVIQFVPWIELGFFSFAGTFDVDAGEATGVEEYENPAREYVVGGSGDGENVVVAPEIGLGGELTLMLAKRKGQPVNLVVEGYYAIFDFHGSTDDLGISSRNDKDLDVDYDAYTIRGLFEFPLSKDVDLIAGAEYKVVKAEADSNAKDRSLEETLAKREKFDKHIELELHIVNVFAGCRW